MCRRTPRGLFTQSPLLSAQVGKSVTCMVTGLAHAARAGGTPTAGLDRGGWLGALQGLKPMAIDRRPRWGETSLDGQDVSAGLRVIQLFSQVAQSVNRRGTATPTATSSRRELWGSSFSSAWRASRKRARSWSQAESVRTNKNRSLTPTQSTRSIMNCLQITRSTCDNRPRHAFGPSLARVSSLRGVIDLLIP